jgi:hypothetical protein
MPDTRTARGPHPKDADCFAPSALPTLAAAVAELSWLLDHGYSKKAALTLVGDRHALRDRQRAAVQRCAASAEECRRRADHRVRARDLAGDTLLVDGYNVLLTVEAALSGGVLLLGRDGALRDLTSMGGADQNVRSTYFPLSEERETLGPSILLRSGLRTSGSIVAVRSCNCMI